MARWLEVPPAAARVVPSALRKMDGLAGVEGNCVGQLAESAIWSACSFVEFGCVGRALRV